MMRFQAFAAIAFCVAMGCSADATSSASAPLLGSRCQSSAQCGALLFCSTDAAQSCDDEGVCAARAESAECDKQKDEVCACDGKTYPSACAAHAAGASVLFDGVCGCAYDDADVDGDTLAETAWTDRTESYFYSFVGDGTRANDSGTFTSRVAPPCTRENPPCATAVTKQSGTFTTHESTLDLRYENGATASFRAQHDCANRWRITGADYGQTMMLQVTKIAP